MPSVKKRGRGRPKLTGEDAPAKMLGIRASKGFLARLDRWRKAQEDKPSQSEAVRRLADKAMAGDGY